MFLIFFSVVIVVYSSINYYIYRHLLPIFNNNPLVKNIYLATFIVLASSYFFYRIFDKIHSTPFVKIFGQIGSIWLIIMVYALFILISFDVFYLIFKYCLPTVFKSISSIYVIKYILPILFLMIITVLTLIGIKNAKPAKVKEITIKSSAYKKLNRPYKIAYASDLHINDLFFPDAVKYLVDIVNKNDVDFMLLGGDVFTEDVSHLSYHDSGGLLKSINTKYGVYTVFGNHEYIGSIESAINHFNKYNIKILNDNSVTINDEIIVVGRDDIVSENMNKKKRASIKELLTPQSDSMFTILIDHQPKSFAEGKGLPIDLYLSGHTHHGQMFPFSLITKKVFDNSWGLIKREDSYYYVSCGYGFWGPPARIGSHSELVIFTIE
ncbi:MAG: metallophosphoesterase [Candidatus Cloacimonadales bacterium]|nr:metallophosphoesterase [Candidatus Cloacimonadota bacterium]MDD2650434.1 metallophosphoesterase [Candidatus Cloacimonadota bacterium]MDD3501296.1 metallophosphoesterase [Candidatus Cloacimonadota bacterium]MDX9976634.1 metallophosphoesterase [Candidatus Cloacimonadales bacterium]